ncbi:MAG TPA: NmrA family transcriptional regulator [Nocardioidaceae bacterium]
MTILITGGTGKTGYRVAHRLTGLGHSVRAVTRHSDPPFDWHDDSTWDAAITGCTSAYVTFQPDLALPGADAIIGAFARRAVKLGCTRLVLLSGRGEDGAQRSEAALIAAGADWTILRSAFFFQNFTEAFWAEEIATGSLTMVESTVAEPFVDADDIADVAVATLLDPAHAGRIHELSGPRLITFEGVTNEISMVTGRSLEYQRLPVDDYVAALVSAGFTQEEATGLAYLFDQVLDGRNAHLETGVAEILGREPRDLTAFLNDTLTSRTPSSRDRHVVEQR